MLNLLIGPITDLAGTWLNGKVEKSKAETGAKVARAKAEATIMERKATGELDWDLEMAKGSQSSWKDVTPRIPAQRGRAPKALTGGSGQGRWFSRAGC